MSSWCARAARVTGIVALLLSTFLPGTPAAEGSGPGAPGGEGLLLRLKLADFDPMRGQPALPEHLSLETEPSSGVFVVQFRRPIAPALLDAVRRAGAQTLKYLPDQAYLVRLPGGAAAALRAMSEVRWLGPVQPGWKISPDLGVRPYADPTRRQGGFLYATADLFPGEDGEAAAAAATAAGADVLQVVRFADVTRLKLHARRESLEAVSRIPAVAWIEEAAEITTRNNTTRWVIQTDVQSSTTVWDRGLHGEGQVVGHIDGRIDMNACFFRDSTNNTPGPAHRKVIAYRSSTGLGADSHGTHTAGTSAGDQFPLNGTLDWNGNAYAAKISHSNLNDISGSGTQFSNLYQYLTDAHDDGARVHTNSWGDDGTTAYTTWCVDVDKFSYDHEDSLVLFAVTNGSTLKTPENAKNCVGVGASQNGLSDDNHCSGGRGPTSDGRRKPELYAPGCSIVSARSSSACSTTSSTGTSMASPAVTAAGALVNQYYREGWYPSGTKTADDAVVPSAALVKATLTDSSVDMTGVPGYPSTLEGWGRVLLENALFFEGDTRKLSMMADVRNADGLTTAGETTYPLTVQGSGERLRVTLVFTEPPAALLSSAATTNDLDLEVVTPSGAVYLGNAIDPNTGLSMEGGAPDPKNNVETVIVNAPQPGEWTVRVRGRAVNEGNQGYAVVASGDVEPFSPGALRYQAHAVEDSLPLGNADTIVDPGETIVMPVTLRNSGSTNVSGVAARLTSDHPDEVKIVAETASFPDMAPDATGTSVAPHFRYTVAPGLACGSRVRFTLGTASSDGQGTTSFLVDIGRAHADYANATPASIPKKSSSGVTSTVQVAEAFTIRDANLAVDVAHGNVGELVMTLRSPSGTSVTLHNRTRAGTANIVTVYDRDRQPDGPGSMSDFDGQLAQGTWTLTVVDNVGGSTGAGTLRNWTLELDSTVPLNCSPLACGVDPVPVEVAPGLVLGKENGADLRLSWPVVPGATGYRVWRSATAGFTEETLLGTTASTTLVEPGALADSASWHYEARAVNACEWEGP